MKEKSVITKNYKQTIKLAKVFAKTIKQNTLIIFNGDLGAGKTTFTKGLAKGLKIKNEIISPTFTIFNEFENKKNRLLHFDMYRLKDENELYEAGLNEYLNLNNFNDKKTICVVEWASNVSNAIPKNQNNIVIDIIKINDNERKFIFKEG